MKKNKKLQIVLLISMSFFVSMIPELLFTSSKSNLSQKVKPSFPTSESEDFSAEAHYTKGLDIEFIDEYQGYSPTAYCDQFILDGPYGDHYKVLVLRDAQIGLNTWSVHHLDHSYSLGSIEFSLRLGRASSTTNPNYHYIKFRDTSNAIAFQLRFDIYSFKVYYYTGSTWALITTLTESEWYQFTIDFNIDIAKFDIEIIEETTSSVVSTITNANYENDVLIEEFFLTTTVSHYSGNTIWDDFIISGDVYSPIESQLFTDIVSVNLQEGKDYTGDGNVNSLRDLKYTDGNKYEIEGEWNSFSSKYLIEAYFSFGANLDIFPLDYYDLFLFLKIDALEITGGNLEFQAYSTYQWVTITPISSSEILLNPYFLERSTEFRIIGGATEVPIVKIEQMRLKIAHDGNIGPTIELDNCITGYEMLSKYPSSGYVEDNLWWEDYDGEIIGNTQSNVAFMVATSARVESHVRMFLELPEQGTMTGYKGSDISARYKYQTICISTGNPPYTGYSYSYIKDMNTGSWSHTHSHGYSSSAAEIEDSWHIDGSNLDNQYIDYDSSKDAYFFDLRFKTYAWIDWWFFGTQGAGAGHVIDEIDCSIELEGYGFDNYNYPDLNVDRETDYYFEITSNGNYMSSSITSVEFLVQNETYYSGWNSVNKVGENWQLELDRYDYENGEYKVWIRVTDEYGYSSYDCYPLEIEHKNSPLYWEGPIEGETIIFNCTTIETSDAIFDIYIHVDTDYFNGDIKFYIDNGIGGIVDRTPPGGLVNGKNSINLEPYDNSINGNITAIIEGTDTFGIIHNDDRNFIFRKMISGEEIEFDRGIHFLGNELYAIVYDPNGDRSWASFRNTESYSHTWKFDWSFNIGVDIDLKITVKDIFTFGTYYHFNFEYLHENIIIIESMDITEIKSTTTWDATSSSTGPGRGDTYWGEAIYIPYYTTAIRAEFWGAEGSYEYINPTLNYGMNFTGQIIGGPNEVPSEWLEENYILQAEQNGGKIPTTADITWFSEEDNGLGNRTITGGGRDLEHTHLDKISYTTTDTFTFDVDFGVYLGLVTIYGGKTETISETDENVKALTRTYHMEDFDYYEDVQKGDIITNRIGIDNRFGTYIFETISDACFTSDPWEHNTNDWRPPIIGEPEIDLDSNGDGIGPCANDEPIIIVDIDDESEIQSAYIKYSINGGLTWNTAPLIEYPADPGTWEGQIPSYPKGTIVLWYIEAIDLFENIKNKTDGWGNPFSYTVLNLAPQVTLLTPEDASTHYNTLYISWSASDLDNDDLTFTLSYTVNGVTKYLIASDLTEYSYEWDISGLGSLDVYIIIEVFDGTTQVEDRNEYVVYLNP